MIRMIVCEARVVTERRKRHPRNPRVGVPKVKEIQIVIVLILGRGASFSRDGIWYIHPFKYSLLMGETRLAVSIYCAGMWVLSFTS